MSVPVMALLVVLGARPATPPLPSGLDLETIRAVAVQHDGRWMPLDTLARDVVERVTGRAWYQGQDPVLWLLAWTFDPETWREVPLIRIPQAELRAELDLPESQTVFSWSQLTRHRRLLQLIGDLGRIESGRKLNPLEAKVADIRDKLTLLQRAFQGQVIRVIPDPDDVLGAWRPVGSGPAAHGQAPAPTAVQDAWQALADAFRRNEPASFSAASRQLADALGALPAAHRPSAERLRTELTYNRLRPFRAAWIVMLVGTLLAAVALVVGRRWCDGLALAGMVAGFAVLSYGIWLRWQIAGRIPAANMYESLLFLGWGVGAFAIVSMVLLPHRVVPVTASAMGAVALILADCLPMDHYVRPIPPVLLDTIWMSIHVPVIMVSYAVLALAVLIAHVQLLVMALVPARRHWVGVLDALHHWYVLVGSILLVAGIIAGSMWAASSWGRYWGWDPKEVWSLVAFLGYLAILHVRLDPTGPPRWVYGLAGALAVVFTAMVVPKLAPMSEAKVAILAGTLAATVLFLFARGAMADALKSILAFWLIVMTYVGVNYVLGTGLHSYGFGTGAVARYLLWVGGVDLALVVLTALVALIRGAPQPAASEPAGA